MIQISKVRLAVFALVFALCFAVIGAGTVLAAQNHMVNARNYLNSALSELQAAESNKGGHRNNAINYVKEALDQVNLGIQYANGQ